MSSTAATLFSGALPTIIQAAVEQGKEAILILGQASKPLAAKGGEILIEFEGLTVGYFRQDIDEESARITMTQLLLSLENLGFALKNMAEIEAYEKGKVILANVIDVLLSIGKIALKLGVSALDSYLAGALKGNVQKWVDAL